MVLPEELRSQLLRSYSRDELKNYHRALLYAVETWRQAGVWRVPSAAIWWFRFNSGRQAALVWFGATAERPL